jgi:hypothetical protein
MNKKAVASLIVFAVTVAVVVIAYILVRNVDFLEFLKRLHGGG